MSSMAAFPRTWRPARPTEIEEERRLLYVAMTRAKDELHLIVPQRFYVRSRPHTATGTSTRSAAVSFPRR